jgi:hypothetical protein
MTYEDRTSKALDRALEMTFPASDPIAVYIPAKRRADAKPRTPSASKHDARTSAPKTVS